jgi:hypothetical protein
VAPWWWFILAVSTTRPPAIRPAPQTGARAESDAAPNTTERLVELIDEVVTRDCDLSRRVAPRLT